MARRISEPPDTVDALTAHGDMIMTRTPEAAQPYRDLAARVAARQAAGLPPEGSQAVQAAPSAGRVDARLAAQARDKRVHALQADLMRYEKEAQRPAVGMGGMVVPHLLDRQRAVEGVCEGIRLEIEELAALDGDELIEWAVNSNAIRFTQAGSALL
jgi:hypothetical protein